jgi:citrate synthase
MVNSGLEGIVAARTRLSHVDGERGELVIGGFPVDELAQHATFEETTWLLWHGELPSTRQLEAFHIQLAAERSLPAATVALLNECACVSLDPMDALRMAAGTISIQSDDAYAIVARFPTIIATFSRLRRGAEPIAPREDLGHAANFLYMLAGEAPEPEQVRGLETYLNTVVDHGLNASTFTARVITSTGSDLVSAVVGALGALKGPLHGGAPGPALDMVFEIGEASRAEDVLRRKIEAGDKLMGFGHRVYKVRDPRADVLAAAAERMYTRVWDMSLYGLARAVEATAIRLLEEYKPGRRLQTNVEFYTALLLHGLGLDTPLFTPTFAVSRVSGWIAHAFEQRSENRIIRPQSEYSGPRDRKWVSLSNRVEAPTQSLTKYHEPDSGQRPFPLRSEVSSSPEQATRGRDG